jgi:hypothetical protein
VVTVNQSQNSSVQIVNTPYNSVQKQNYFTSADKIDKTKSINVDSVPQRDKDDGLSGKTKLSDRIELSFNMGGSKLRVYEGMRAKERAKGTVRVRAIMK